MNKSIVLLCVLLAAGAVPFSCRSNLGDVQDRTATVEAKAVDASAVVGPAPAPAPLPPLPATVERALDWLAGAQQPDGGFGAGSHARQDVRDAHAVPTDPATTAVAAIALVRSGNTLADGDYRDQLTRATEYLLRCVETAPVEGPQITDQDNTQPQAKMGRNVDTALTAQFFARLLEALDDGADLRPRITAALEKCVAKIEQSQADDGSWTAGGWAPVLQSSQMCTALELAQMVGCEVDEARLGQARAYQQRQVGHGAGAGAGAGGAGERDAEPGVAGRSRVAADLDGFGVSFDAFAVGASAGVPLYAAASNQRSVVGEAKAAENLVEQAKIAGELPKDATANEENLTTLGFAPERAAQMAASVVQNEFAKQNMFDDRLLAGFGNNGGEEFLSYQMQSEAMVIDGGEQWQRWSPKIRERLEKVQNADGSWSGHHCITSPTFCTATAIACLTADRDVEWLRKSSALAGR